MASGPILPSSIYFGGASGNASPTFYVPTTNTNTAGAIEGIGVIASLGSFADAPIPIQFNLPEVIPSGQAKLRLLAMSSATTGNAKITVADGVTAPGSNIGVATLTTDASAQTVAWSAADVLLETKINLATTMIANGVLTVLLTFNASGWTLAQDSVWIASLVWE